MGTPPRTAMRPATPLPGSTGWPYRSITNAFCPSLKRAALLLLSLEEIERPMPLASLLFRKSISIACGACSSRRSLPALPHIIPEDDTAFRLLMFQRCGAASSASTMGRQNASPTIHRSLTGVSCMACNRSCTSNCFPVKVTSVPARLSRVQANTNAVPCISGAAGKPTGAAIPFAPCATMRRCTWARSACAGSPVVLDATYKSCWRHITPRGRPVVPPV